MYIYCFKSASTYIAHYKSTVLENMISRSVYTIACWSVRWPHLVSSKTSATVDRTTTRRIMRQAKRFNALSAKDERFPILMPHLYVASGTPLDDQNDTLCVAAFQIFNRTSNQMGRSAPESDTYMH